MFVVKDPDLFAIQVIPQYFDHNKFSSFARQLNFYGFRKMQSKPIKNSDYDSGTAKHVTFYNENFKRGRCDLLKKIQRSTRGGGSATGQDQQKEIQTLRDRVSSLEQQIADMNNQFEDRVRRLELEMLARMEQMMLTVQQQQRTQMQLQKATSVGSAASQQLAAQNWEQNAISFPRGNSINSVATSVLLSQAAGSNDASSIPAQPSVTFQQQPTIIQQQSQGSSGMPAPATLPPHPKQKQLPLGGPIPGSMGAPPDRLNSLRGISQLSRGISGLSRGASVESTASAVLMRNSWEDKLFSMLMLDGNDPNASGQNMMNASTVAPTPLQEDSNVATSNSPQVVSNRSTDMNPDGDMSSVSSSGMP